MEKLLQVFCCYCRKDQQYLYELKSHLMGLQREKLIKIEADVDISPGKEWKREIDQHLKNAQILLLLISPDFLASEYCYEQEMRLAIAQHEQGAACVVPVIIRPTAWGNTPFSKLQALPKDAKAVISWQNRDEAWKDVADGICKVIAELHTTESQGELGCIPDRSPLPEPSAPQVGETKADLSLLPPLVNSQILENKQPLQLKSPSLFKKAVLVLLMVALLCLIVAGALSRFTGSVTYTNPVLNHPFPDPDVILAHGRYYTYATGNTKSYVEHIQVSSSSDLVDWGFPTEALPKLPSWAWSGTTTAWGPSVIQLGHTYVMYYSAPEQPNLQCIGVATSMNPTGPFSDTSRSPLTCQNSVSSMTSCKTHPSQPTPNLGGTIDPAPFMDSGKLYLYYKNDGNSIKNDGNNIRCPTAIWVQQLSPDGRSFAPGTQAVSLLTNNPSSWEGSMIEAPFMFLHDEQYYLFFSGNTSAINGNTAEGYATCSGPLGPCIQAPENPILSEGESQVIGPAGASLIQIGTQTWMVYHSWQCKVYPDGTKLCSRPMNIDRVNWVDGKPVVLGPTTTPQPIP